jgi:hypothetical protein
MFTVAPIPNAIDAIDMRRQARPPDWEENKRHVTSRTLSNIYVFLITFMKAWPRQWTLHSSQGTLARFNSTYKAVELVSGQGIIYVRCEATIETMKICW